jgi:ubiquinone/menaquinone biosynthesis C-methylase UbiE
LLQRRFLADNQEVLRDKWTRAMDYDRTGVAASYDRARALTPEALSVWKRLLTLDVYPAVISRAVDLGCGTGRFSELLAAEFNCQVIGVDPSKKMLDEARSKLPTQGIIFMEGSGEAIPLPDSSADMVFMSMVYHHFADTAAVVLECRRVLCPSGYACIRNSTRETDFPHGHFFPSMETLAASDLPSRQDIKAVFEKRGFAVVVSRVVDLHSNLRLGPVRVRSGTEIETDASLSLNLSANFVALSGESGLLFDCGLPGFDDGV